MHFISVFESNSMVLLLWLLVRLQHYNLGFRWWRSGMVYFNCVLDFVVLAVTTLGGFEELVNIDDVLEEPPLCHGLYLLFAE
jgi:hypothetical protein